VKYNNQKGNLALVIACTVVLLIIGLGFLFFTLIMGGGRETQNAVDAGALNAAKVALIRPGVPLNAADQDEAQFLGVADAQNQIALGNINRVWGQVLLVALNHRAMQIEQSALPAADTSVTKVVNAARSINDRLATALNPNGGALDPQLQTAFLSVAQANSVRMLDTATTRQERAAVGANTVSVATSGNNAGFSDENQASNVSMDNAQLSNILSSFAGYSDQSTFDSQVVGSILNPNRDGNFMRGYRPINLGNTQVYFVPLRPNTKPRMLSQSAFVTQKPAVGVTQNPVPNTFLTRGTAPSPKTPGTLLNFAAVALSEPLNNVNPIAMPHGYIRIRNIAGIRWQGVNTPAMARGQDIGDDGRFNGMLAAGGRGMHVAEYANHQLLLARSDFDPHKNAPAFNGGQLDAAAAQMDNPYAVLMKANNIPVRSSNENRLVYSMSSDVDKITTPVPPPDGPRRDDPPAPNNTCGGLLLEPLKSSTSCRDLADSTSADRVVATKLLRRSDIDFNQNPPGLLGTAAGDPILIELAKQLNLLHNENDTIFGSENHPHIWSIYPPADGSDAQILNVGKGRNPDDPTDAVLMYTGVLKMPNEQGQHRVSRNPVNRPENPILFGTPGKLSDYLDPPNGAAELSSIRNRIVQRCREIDPSFNGDLRQFDETINMNQDAYIFKEPGSAPGVLTMKVVQANTMGNLPQFLVNEINALHTAVPAGFDGKGIPGSTIVYDNLGNIVSDNKTMLAPGLVNLAFDWGYPLPYENDDQPQGADMSIVQLVNKFTFRPCTGLHGNLGVLEMKAFITNGNPGCEKLGNLTTDAGGTLDKSTRSYVSIHVDGKSMATPEDCPCVTFKAGSYPAAGSMQTGATPGPWPGMNACGGTTPNDLPNCSHTGAC